MRKVFFISTIFLALLSCAGPSATITTDEQNLVGDWKLLVDSGWQNDTTLLFSNTHTDFASCHLNLTDVDKDQHAGFYNAEHGLNCIPQESMWKLNSSTTLNIGGGLIHIEYQVGDSMVLRLAGYPSAYGNTWYYLKR